MIIYRVGAHWAVTIIESNDDEQPDSQGRRPSDRLIAMACTPEDAQRIIALMNAGEAPS